MRTREEILETAKAIPYEVIGVPTLEVLLDIRDLLEGKKEKLDGPEIISALGKEVGEYAESKKCDGSHCKCMNKDCPNRHYADCIVHNSNLI